ncbi:MAG: hypothetical protein D6813_05145 [Calditrichaeota bacterium]|nr:MAG: hypothetical protein D6813_05145 [Calditrichota bacterium]
MLGVGAKSSRKINAWISTLWLLGALLCSDVSADQRGLRFLRDISFEAESINLITATNHQLYCIFSTPTAIHCLNENGDTLWSKPALSIEAYVPHHIESDFLLARRSRIEQDSVEILYLINVRSGEIADNIRLTIKKGEHIEKILHLPPYCFVHLYKESPLAQTRKRFVVLSIAKGKIRQSMEFKTCAWISPNPHYDFQNNLMLFASISSCNDGFPYQGVNDCTGGIFLTSLDSWQIISRILPAVNGYVNSSFLLKDSLLYILHRSNPFNPVPYVELNIARYPTLDVLKRQQYDLLSTGDPLLIEKQDGVYIFFANSTNGALYKVNSKLAIVKTFQLNGNRKQYPILFNRFKLIRNFFINSANLKRDQKRELLVLEAIRQIPEDPRGTIRNRYGMESCHLTAYLFDDDLNILGSQKLGNIERYLGLIYLPEVQKLFCLNKRGIKVFQVF